MFGIITEQATQNQRFGKVDTRNDAFGELRIYQLPNDIIVNSTVEYIIRNNQSNGKPYAVFKNKAERNIAVFNTESRNEWYKWGENKEQDFITKIVPKLQLDIQINPQKETMPWVIDLVDYTNDKFADLKVQNTPFFTASRYCYKGVPYDPEYTVTFNKKDYENYMQNYPDCHIYFWVNWEQTHYKNIVLNPLWGIWRASISDIDNIISNGEATLHSYQFRRNDDHNAKESFLLNLNDSRVFERLI
ncbi:hypothetical protein GJI91_08900 [Lactococcus lactis subsp. cremoris]|nr:hypothetical protein [Lactococcus cremoris]MRM79006.1 hypothetical protein [Lactococcus cremoris]